MPDDFTSVVPIAVLEVLASSGVALHHSTPSSHVFPRGSANGQRYRAQAGAAEDGGAASSLFDVRITQLSVALPQRSGAGGAEGASKARAEEAEVLQQQRLAVLRRARRRGNQLLAAASVGTSESFAEGDEEAANPSPVVNSSSAFKGCLLLPFDAFIVAAAEDADAEDVEGTDAGPSPSTIVGHVVSLWPRAGPSLADAVGSAVTCRDLMALFAACRRYLDHCCELPHHGNWSGHAFVRWCPDADENGDSDAGGGSADTPAFPCRWAVTDTLMMGRPDVNSGNTRCISASYGAAAALDERVRVRQCSTVLGRHAYREAVRSEMLSALGDVMGCSDGALQAGAPPHVSVVGDDGVCMRLSYVRALLEESLREVSSLRYPLYGSGVGGGGPAGGVGIAPGERTMACGGEPSSSASSPHRGAGAGSQHTASGRVGSARDAVITRRVMERLRDVSPAGSDEDDGDCLDLKARRAWLDGLGAADVAHRRKEIGDVLAADDDATRWLYRGLQAPYMRGGTVAVLNAPAGLDDPLCGASPSPDRAGRMGDDGAELPAVGAYHDRFYHLLKSHVDGPSAGGDASDLLLTGGKGSWGGALTSDRGGLPEEEPVEEEEVAAPDASPIRGRQLRAITMASYEGGGVVEMKVGKEDERSCCAVM